MVNKPVPWDQNEYQHRRILWLCQCEGSFQDIRLRGNKRIWQNDAELHREESEDVGPVPHFRLMFFYFVSYQNFSVIIIYRFLLFYVGVTRCEAVSKRPSLYSSRVDFGTPSDCQYREDWIWLYTHIELDHVHIY